MYTYIFVYIYFIVQLPCLGQTLIKQKICNRLFNTLPAIISNNSYHQNLTKVETYIVFMSSNSRRNNHLARTKHAY